MTGERWGWKRSFVVVVVTIGYVSGKDVHLWSVESIILLLLLFSCLCVSIWFWTILKSMLFGWLPTSIYDWRSYTKSSHDVGGNPITIGTTQSSFFISSSVSVFSSLKYFFKVKNKWSRQGLGWGGGIAPQPNWSKRAFVPRTTWSRALSWKR